MKQLIFILVCLCFANAHGQTGLRQAKQLIEEGKYNESNLVLDSCSHCPADSSLYLRAYAKIKQNQLKEALVYCTKLQRANKNYYEVWFLRGLMSSMNGNYIMAADQFTRVLNQNSHHPKALYNRALAKGLLEDYEGAISDLDTCISVEPDYAAAYYSRGYWREATMQYDKAIADYSKTIALDANYKEAYLALAYALHLKGDKRKACETLDKAIEKGSVAAADLKDSFCK